MHGNLNLGSTGHRRGIDRVRFTNCLFHAATSDTSAVDSQGKKTKRLRECIDLAGTLFSVSLMCSKRQASHGGLRSRRTSRTGKSYKNIAMSMLLTQNSQVLPLIMARLFVSRRYLTGYHHAKRVLSASPTLHISLLFRCLRSRWYC